MKNSEFKFDNSNDKENPSLWKGHSERKSTKLEDLLNLFITSKFISSLLS